MISDGGSFLFSTLITNDWMYSNSEEKNKRFQLKTAIMRQSLKQQLEQISKNTQRYTLDEVILLVKLLAKSVKLW